MTTQTRPSSSVPAQMDIALPAFLRNVRVIQAIVQILFVILAVFALSALWTNILNTLDARNLSPNFAFLNSRAGFSISDAPSFYTPDSTYADAFRAGAVNTLRIVSVGLVLATVLGIFLGIFLLSSNFLVKSISRGYVEILRNTPLLVQLIFWYYVVLLGLPRDAVTVPDEGIFVLPLRVPLYLLFGAGLWLWSTRNRDLPRNILNGALLGIVIMELVFAVVGYSTLLMVGFGIAGAVLVFGPFGGSIPEKHLGRATGIGAMVLLSGIGALVLLLLHEVGILGHEYATWWAVSPGMYFSRSGIVFPEIIGGQYYTPWLVLMVATLVVSLVLNRRWKKINEEQGKAIPRTLYATGIFLVVLILSWVILSGMAAPDEVTVGEGDEAVTMPVEQARAEELLTVREDAALTSQPFTIILPQKTRFRFFAGFEFAPEYTALLVGLVIYTSAFIGEIVRAGIQAVPYGQIEASRAVGLTTPQTLRLVVLPQALRVIIPPMGNQYLNLSKNSSLAVAIAYSDTYLVGTTIMNQSGQSVTGFSIILLVYLSLSLLISLVMNIVNSRFKLKTR